MYDVSLSTISPSIAFPAIHQYHILFSLLKTRHVTSVQYWKSKCQSKRNELLVHL